MLSAIHRRDDQNRYRGQRRVHSSHDFAQVPFVSRHLIVGSVFALVRAVVENQQIGLAMSQLFGPVRFVHHAREQARISTIHAQTIVNNPGPVVLQHGAKHADAPGHGLDFESVRARLGGFDFPEG